MEEETIRMLCNKKGMKEPELFIKWFMKRFPNESDNIHNYCNEWIDRFMGGNPTCYMDNESKKIFECMFCGTNTKNENWQDEINEHLANLHPHEIIEGIIKPAIEQVVDDFEDSLNLYDTREQKDLTNKLISFWKGIRKRMR